MRDRAKRHHEERVLLYQVFTEGAQTIEEKALGVRNAQFIEKSLELMKVKTLMGIGKRGSSQLQFNETLENMIEMELMERHELGLIPKKKISLEQINLVYWDFTFKYIKQKAKALRAGKRAINYKNSTVITAQTLDEAQRLLEQKAKKLGDVIVEHIENSKRLAYVITEDLDLLHHYEIEIVQ